MATKKTTRHLNAIKKRRRYKIENSSSLNFLYAKKQNNILQNTPVRIRDGVVRRRYGFTRIGTNQIGFLGKNLKKRKKAQEYRATIVPNISRGTISHRYLNSDYIDHLYENRDMETILSYVYKTYSDFDRLWTDYRYGFRDKLFTRILRLSKIVNNDEYFDIFRYNYEEIIQEAITQFIEIKHERILLGEYVGGAYYKIIFQTLPVLISRYFSSILGYVKNISEYDEDEELGYIDQDFNLLQINIIDEFQKIK